MADPHHENKEAVVVDLIDHPAVADADPKQVFHAGEFLDASWTGATGERFQRGDDPPLIRSGELQQLAPRGRT